MVLQLDPHLPFSGLVSDEGVFQQLVCVCPLNKGKKGASKVNNKKKKLHTLGHLKQNDLGCVLPLDIIAGKKISFYDIQNTKK